MSRWTLPLLASLLLVWAVPGSAADNKVDLKTTPIILGPALAMDPQSERFTGEFAERANKYVNRDGDGGYRKPYVVPESV